MWIDIGLRELDIPNVNNFAAPAEVHKLITAATRSNPDGLVDIQGKHCLHVDCIMQTDIPAVSRNIPDVDKLFCNDCWIQVADNKQKKITTAATAQICDKCLHLDSCMIQHPSVWEDASACSYYDIKLLALWRTYESYTYHIIHYLFLYNNNGTLCTTYTTQGITL